jgi:hypothetical protein
MICDVHGCPACSVTLPTPSKRQPTGDAFSSAAGLGGCAQLANTAVIANTATEPQIDFIFLTFLPEIFHRPGVFDWFTLNVGRLTEGSLAGPGST